MDEPHAYTNSQNSPWPKLKGNHHFHLIVFFMLGHGVYTQMSFCLGIPKIIEIGTPTILEAHNFVWKPPIEVRFKPKL